MNFPVLLLPQWLSRLGSSSQRCQWPTSKGGGRGSEFDLFSASGGYLCRPPLAYPCPGQTRHPTPQEAKTQLRRGEGDVDLTISPLTSTAPTRCPPPQQYPCHYAGPECGVVFLTLTRPAKNATPSWPRRPRGWPEMELGVLGLGWPPWPPPQRGWVKIPPSSFGVEQLTNLRLFIKLKFVRMTKYPTLLMPNKVTNLNCWSVDQLAVSYSTTQ